MPSTLKWASDLHPMRERALRARNESWARKDIEELFQVSRASAQTLMRAIGGVTNIAGKHLVDRSAVVEFLETMIAAENLEEAFRDRLEAAPRPPNGRRLLLPIPKDFEHVRFKDLPPEIRVSPGRLEIVGNGLEIMERLVILAKAMETDETPFLAEWNRSDDTDKRLKDVLQALRNSAVDQAD